MAGGEEARHFKPETNPIPDHAHLLHTREELAALLDGKISDALLDAVLASVYDSDFINRLFYEDHVRAFETSDFVIEELTTEEEYVPSTRLGRLRQRYPGVHRFDVRGYRVLLRKPRSGRG